jgi:RNA-binding protein 26
MFPEGPSFIDTLFTVLRTKSYLPYSATSSTSGYPQPGASTPDAGIPIPLDALLSPTSPTPAPERGLKRSNENDDRDGRPPAKGPRLNSDGQFSRYSDRRGGGPSGHSTGGWGGLGNQGGRPHMNENGHGGGGNMLMGRGMNGGMAQMNPRPPQNYQPPETKRSICRDYHRASLTFGISRDYGADTT